MRTATQLESFSKGLIDGVTSATFDPVKFDFDEYSRGYCEGQTIQQTNQKVNK